LSSSLSNGTPLPPSNDSLLLLKCLYSTPSQVPFPPTSTRTPQLACTPLPCLSAAACASGPLPRAALASHMLRLQHWLSTANIPLQLSYCSTNCPGWDTSSSQQPHRHQHPLHCKLILFRHPYIRVSGGCCCPLRQSHLLQEGPPQMLADLTCPPPLEH
jgi:hypothetical protein